jgi:hypothetical protein
LASAPRTLDEPAEEAEEKEPGDVIVGGERDAPPGEPYLGCAAAECGELA